MKKSVFLSVLFLSAALLSASDISDTSPYLEYDKALGGSFGNADGVGLSYQQWLGGTGWQTTAGFVYYPGSFEVFRYNVSGSLLFLLYSDVYSDWISGNLYFFTSLIHQGSVRTATGEPADPLGFYPGAGISAGVGFEPLFFRHFSVPVQFGYTAYWEFSSFMPMQAGFAGQVSLRYRY